MTDIEPDVSSPLCETAVSWVKVRKSTETPRRANQQPHRLSKASRTTMSAQCAHLSNVSVSGTVTSECHIQQSLLVCRESEGRQLRAMKLEEKLHEKSGWCVLFPRIFEITCTLQISVSHYYLKCNYLLAWWLNLPKNVAVTFLLAYQEWV